MHVSKLSASLQTLKDQLRTLMAASAELIERNSQTDSGARPDNLNQTPPPRFEILLEDFLSTCVTIELNLRTMQECIQQGRASHQNLPLAVSNMKGDINDTKVEMADPHGMVSYNQYLSTIKYQIDTAESIKSILTEFVNQLNLGQRTTLN